MRALVAGGGDINALESRRYDVITIAAVKDDVRMVKLALELGGSAKLITSPYDGTALIAAAHLGHAEVVQALIDGGWSATGIVVISQLVAFLSYQIRVVAGLRVLKARPA